MNMGNPQILNFPVSNSPNLDQNTVLIMTVVSGTVKEIARILLKR